MWVSEPRALQRLDVPSQPFVYASIDTWNFICLILKIRHTLLSYWNLFESYKSNYKKINAKTFSNYASFGQQPIPSNIVQCSAVQLLSLMIRQIDDLISVRSSRHTSGTYSELFADHMRGGD